jgi:hypothetical protein
MTDGATSSGTGKTHSHQPTKGSARFVLSANIGKTISIGRDMNKRTSSAILDFFPVAITTQRKQQTRAPIPGNYTPSAAALT